MITLRIDSQFHGPSILDMEPLLGLSDEAIEVSFDGTKSEIKRLKELKQRDITVVIRNMNEMERTASLLGLPYLMTPELIQSGYDSISDPSGAWRQFTREQGPQVSRGAALRAVAQTIRFGGDIPDLRKLIVESYLDNTSSMDADALLGLRVHGARV